MIHVLLRIGEIAVGVWLLVSALICYALCKASGRASRAEEAAELKSGIEVK